MACARFILLLAALAANFSAACSSATPAATPSERAGGGALPARDAAPERAFDAAQVVSATDSAAAVGPHEGGTREAGRVASDAAASLPSPFPDLLTIEDGALPIVLSAPHGGEAAVPGVSERTNPAAVNTLDYATYAFALAIQEQLVASTGKRAHLVAARASRKYIDFNRDATAAYEAAAAAPVYDAYHAALARAVSAARQASPAAALLVDVHGQGVAASLVFRGTRNGQTADLASLHALPAGFLTTLNTSGVEVSPASASTLVSENPSFNGGFIVGSQGLSGTGQINAVQLELGRDYRDPTAALTASASKVAAALVAHLQAHGAL